MSAGPASLEEYDVGLVQMLENLTYNGVTEEADERPELDGDLDLKSIQSSLQALMECDLKHPRFVKVRKQIQVLSTKVAAVDESIVLSAQRAEMRKLLESRKQKLKKLDQEYLVKRRLRAQRIESLNQLQGESRRLICTASESLLISDSSSINAESVNEVDQDGNDNVSLPDRQLFYNRGD
ncbi:hypothetical protein BVRB_034900 [Beta vulgaris subsp. vulgaris]|uniref:Uncharacterized protein n=1 Tax=Beta vulgaris subsp. vulgaris TaxID=3555 RepID=A0A0J7YQX5_BETVV|nr:hypothetical protein BVRB_034900 [Beta vulgaris subsp. vulgaris]